MADLKHRFGMEQEMLERIAAAKRWQLVEIHGLLFVCDPLGSGKFCEERGGLLSFRVQETHIGTYSKIQKVFATNLRPLHVDPRIEPLCKCCA